jgi:hypothetical protein
LVFVLATGTQAAEDREIHGRVVDEVGRPVADADVDSFWRANGPVTTRDGRIRDLSKDDELRAFWGSLGEMQPCRPRAVKTGTDGRFSIKMDQFHLALMAMDRMRKHGGIAVTPKGDDESPVEIRLVPLIKVRGSFAGPGAGVKPSWTHVYTLLPDEPTRPLDDTRLVSCGSFEARFEM